MKSKFLKFVGVFAFIVVAISSVCIIFADEAEQVPENTMLISTQAEVIDNDLFKANEIIEVENAIVQGNAFLAGRTVTLKNVEVTGSVAVAAETVRLENVVVNGDIFAAGKTVEIESSTAKNIFTAGATVKASSETEIQRDAYIAGNDILFNAKADKVLVGGSGITFGPKAQVNEANGEADKDPVVEEGASIENNNITVIAFEEPAKVVNIGEIILDIVRSVVSFVIFALFIAFVFIKANKAKMIKKYTLSEIAMNMLVGLAIAIFGVIASIILIIIEFTTPIGFIALFVYIILMICSTAAGTFVITTKVIGDKEPDMKNLLLFTILIACMVELINFLPVIGGLFTMVVGLTGIGTIVNVIFAKNEVKEKKEAIVKE